MKFYSNEEVERLAEARLAELEEALGRALGVPIPIDLLAEQVLGLDFLWEEIEELPGEVVLAGLIARRGLIVLNERRRELFESKPGLERSTKGHEMGHWDLFVDRAALDHPTLPGFDAFSPTERRRSGAGEVEVLRMLLRDPEMLELVRELEARADRPDEARAVNRYAAAISMPRAMVRAEVAGIRRTHWPELYRLAERFGVTISALCVRLQQLDLLHVDDERRLYESKAAATGQASLW